MVHEEFDNKNALMTKIYDEYGHKMHRIACSILQDTHLADDAVQEAMIKILRHSERIDDIYSNKCANFILIVLKNTAIDIYREKKKEKSILLFGVRHEMIYTNNEQYSIENTVKKYALSEKMQQVLSSLKEIDRDIICLFYINELTTKEIAAIIGIKEANVRKRLSRARKSIAAKVDKGEKVNG